MADEPGHRFDGGQAAPDFLTVAQTADVLQIGRSTTYELVGLFVEGDEVRGIPAFLVGGQYRIPRARLEEFSGKPLTWPPAPRPRKTRPRRQSRPEPDATDSTAQSPASAPIEEAVAWQVERADTSTPEEPGQPGAGHDIEDVVDQHLRPKTSSVQVDSTKECADGDRDESQHSLPFEG
jgi:excisionase family DNA binding protein